MAPKPPISVRRPQRPATEFSPRLPVPISHSSVPNVDLDGPEALAFAMRGRISSPARIPEGEGGSDPELLPPFGPAPNSQEPLPEQRIGPIVTVRPDERPDHRRNEAPIDEIPLISVKLPPESGRRLAAVADRRGSKRTIVAIEVLTEPLRQLAAEHRAGRFPELPRIISGTVRSSIAFALPPDLAADLEFVLRQRRAVRAQVVTRLLVPAIEQIYAAEIERATVFTYLTSESVHISIR
jgi:hypothetical protein